MYMYCKSHLNVLGSEEKDRIVQATKEKSVHHAIESLWSLR